MSRKGQRIIAGAASVAVLICALSLDYVRETLNQQAAALPLAVIEDETVATSDRPNTVPRRVKNTSLPATKVTTTGQALTNTTVVKSTEYVSVAEFPTFLSIVSNLTSIVGEHLEDAEEDNSSEAGVDRQFVYKQVDAIYDSLSDSADDTEEDISVLTASVDDLEDDLAALTVSLTGLAFVQGGNAFGTSATLGTTDNQPLSLITNGTERLTITEDGKIGIGTTTPSGALDVNATITTGNASFPIASAANLYSTLSVDPVSDASLFYYYGSKSTISTPNTNSQPILALSAGSFDATHNGSGNFTVLAGIESLASNNSLTGLGGSLIGASLTARNAGGGTVTNAYGLQVSVTKTGSGTTTNAYGVFINNIQGTNTWGLYQTNATNRNYFAGNVNIGTTATSTNSKLTVVSTNVASTTLRLESPRVAIVSGNILGGIDFASNDTTLTTPGTTTASILALANETHTASALGTDLVFSTTNGTTTAERMRILGNGKVGIGTTTPNRQLTVLSTNDVGLKLDTTNSAHSGIEIFQQGAYQWAIYNPQGSSDLRFFDGSGTPLTLKNGGNVGIGTTTPSETLTVNGSILGTGHMALGNRSTVADALDTSFTYLGTTWWWGADVISTNLLIQEESTVVPVGQYPQVAGVMNYLSANPSSDASSTVYMGNETLVTVPSGNAQPIGYILGGNFRAENHSSSGHSLEGLEAQGVTAADGDSYQIIGVGGYASNYAGGTTEYAYGVFASVLNYNGGDTAGAVTNAYALYGTVNSQTYSTTTNAYGLYIDNIGGINTWGVYQHHASDRNYFAGNVNIGTTATNTSSKLTVVSTNVASTTLRLESPRVAIASGNILGGIDFASNDTNLTTPGTTTASILARANETHTGTALGTDLVFSTTNGTTTAERLRILGSGNVGIGTSTPSEMLTVAGNGRFTAVSSGAQVYDLNLTADGTLTTSASDRALKTQEELLDTANTLEKILALQPKSFIWKETNAEDVGLIAQEVAEVFPEIVFTNPVDGYMGINYSRLPALLIAAVQELAGKVSELFVRDEERAEEIERLQNQNEVLNARVEALEDALDIEVEPEQEETPIDTGAGDDTGVVGEPAGDETPVEPAAPPTPTEPEEPVEPQQPVEPPAADEPPPSVLPTP